MEITTTTMLTGRGCGPRRRDEWLHFLAVACQVLAYSVDLIQKYDFKKGLRSFYTSPPAEAQFEWQRNEQQCSHGAPSGSGCCSLSKKTRRGALQTTRAPDCPLEPTCWTGWQGWRHERSLQSHWRRSEGQEGADTAFIEVIKLPSVENLSGLKGILTTSIV